MAEACAEAASDASTPEPQTATMAPREDGADVSTLHGGGMGPDEIMSGKLWLGPGVVNNDEYCETLRSARVTHVVSLTTKPEGRPSKEQLPGKDGTVSERAREMEKE